MRVYFGYKKAPGCAEALMFGLYDVECSKTKEVTWNNSKVHRFL